MNQLKTSININYLWWRPNGKGLDPKHEVELNEDAREKIFEMIGAGFTSGLLETSLLSDEGDDILYNGLWSFEIKKGGKQ